MLDFALVEERTVLCVCDHCQNEHWITVEDDDDAAGEQVQSPFAGIGRSMFKVTRSVCGKFGLEQSGVFYCATKQDAIKEVKHYLDTLIDYFILEASADASYSYNEEETFWVFDLDGIIDTTLAIEGMEL